MKFPDLSKFTGQIKNFGKLAKFKAYQVRPEILLGVGIASVLASTVMACIKSKDVEPIVENAKEKVDELNYIRDNPCAEETPTFKEYIRVYGRTGWQIVKIYAVPGLMMAAGVGCIIGSHGDLKARNRRLLADLVTTQALFQEYRRRVSEAIGEENEQKLFMGAVDGPIALKKVDEDTGEVTYEDSDGIIFNKGPGSMYARNFTPDTSVEYDCRTYADAFLEAKIKHLNWLLTNVPFITLNEVYDELGFRGKYGKCPEGMVVGWTAYPKVDRGDREIIVDRLVGKQPVFDADGNLLYYEDCLRLDFNCYPLEGLV